MKQKTHTLTKIILVCLCALFFVSLAPHVFAQAQDLPQELQYIPLAPLPGIGDTPDTVRVASSLPLYLIAIFKLLIGLAAALAVVMITIGGFQYMSTDAISGKSEGKEKIKQALTGLILAMGSYLILYTLNPKLTQFNLNIDPQPKIDTTSEERLRDQRILNMLNTFPEDAAYKIKICFQTNRQGNLLETREVVLPAFKFASYPPPNQDAFHACLQTLPPGNRDPNPQLPCIQTAYLCTTHQLTRATLGMLSKDAWYKRSTCTLPDNSTVATDYPQTFYVAAHHNSSEEAENACMTLTPAVGDLSVPSDSQCTKIEISCHTTKVDGSR